MANDIQKKVLQSKVQAGEIQQRQDVEGNLPTLEQPIFTTEQRRILGQVYTLILSWRRERRKSVAPTSISSTALIPVVPIEVEA
jgi:hypothetical protein